MPLSGLQKNVIALYRHALREARKKPKVRDALVPGLSREGESANSRYDQGCQRKL